MEKNNHISLKQLKKVLDENHEQYAEYHLSDGWSIVVMRGGGRVFGPFQGEYGESVLWTSPAFRSEEEFEQVFKREGYWNLGGDRMWLAPEYPFFAEKREDFFNTYVVQPEIDPGNYSMEEDVYGNLVLYSILEGKLFESDYEEKRVGFKKTVRKKKNPIRALKNFDQYMEGVEYAGFEQELVTRDTTPEVPMEMEIWNLTQVNPGGTLYVPFTADFDFLDNYTPVTEKILQVKSNFAAVKVDSVQDHKLSFYAANTIGRSAYLNELADGRSYLFVRNYLNDPSSDCICEPWSQPGKTGATLHLYIDGGGQGGFAEFENTGRTFGGKTGREISVDNIDYWFYFGAKEKLAKIAEVLLGIDIYE